ncbi:hypothetical protein [Marinisporobacter balticus]|uniref:Uncharacterized protein n=1 Tax=Marinisporobacter balticus TaxID=2018667 RepID=A0A4R2KVN7_9FIRM|nr:hypothetical protein [Marinisporobacter balticus]TCO75266.1 hypothetical protein EV214_109103 [Marinisporobacter balticus]
MANPLAIRIMKNIAKKMNKDIESNVEVYGLPKKERTIDQKYESLLKEVIYHKEDQATHKTVKKEPVKWDAYLENFIDHPIKEQSKNKTSEKNTNKKSTMMTLEELSNK